MRKVPAIEVKRCFLIADLVRKPTGRKQYLGTLSPKDFKKRLATAKKKVLAMNAAQLDTRIIYRKRLRAYTSFDWSVRTFKTSELGVWRKAGGLPLSFTKGSLADTGRMVKEVLAKNPAALARRARRAIPGIMATALPFIRKEKYLFPIAFKGGTGTNGRQGLAKIKADIDDGCMRATALATSGDKTVRVYFGVPTRNRR